MWREQGTLSIELIFIRLSLSCSFLEGIDVLILLSNYEWRLAKILLQKPEKMVGMEEALKRKEERAKKRKKVKPSMLRRLFLFRVCLDVGRKEKSLRQV